jgi:hypothetical protein
MYFTDHQVRIKTQRIHDYILFNTVAILKASDLGTFYRIRDKAGITVEEKSCYYFKETDKESHLLKACDLIMYKDQDILPIEMKTKLVEEYSFDSEVEAQDSIFGKAARVDHRLFNQEFLVVLAMYTRNDRQSFNFDSSRVMFYYGNQYRKEWTSSKTLKQWRPILQPAFNIPSLFNILCKSPYIK